MNSEVEEAQQVKEEAVAAQRAAEGALRDTKKQVEAQELVSPFSVMLMYLCITFFLLSAEHCLVPEEGEVAGG